MSHSIRISRAAYFFFVMLLCAMFMQAPAQAEVTLSTINVNPSSPTLSVGQTQVFTAAGTYSDGAILPNLSQPVTGVVAAAVGSTHACALLASGAVQCWGSNVYGQLGNGATTDSTNPVTVSGISTATGLAVGTDYSCALLASGAVQCWGYNSSGQLGNGTTTQSTTPVTVSGINNATALAAKSTHMCALLASGAVNCWGNNSFGQLGDGTATNSTTPVAVSGIGAASGIMVGASHSCAVLVSGAVLCWGDNSYGQLGIGTTTSFYTTPVTVSGISTATGLAAGNNYSCALLASGDVTCWGYYYAGLRYLQSDSPIPYPYVIAVSGAMGLAGGGNHVCAVLANGGVRCWGSNFSGELGNGSTTNPASYVYDRGPSTVSGISTAIGTAAGYSQSCAVLASGAMQCWGGGLQFGDQTNGAYILPVTPIGSSGVAGISAGSSSTCDVLTSGAVQCWGNNSKCVLGTGSCVDYNAVVTSPSLVNGISAATQIAMGGAYYTLGVLDGVSHTCVVLASGTVQCWGINSSGQLGNSTTSDSVLPVTVSGISNAVAVAAGYAHTCAMLASGTVKCWGSNGKGQLGNGIATASSTPVTVSGISTAIALAAGDQHMCAVLASGAVQCWGWNYSGQLGNGTTTDSSNPVMVSGISTAMKIAADYGHSCAVLASGAVQCWGRNYSGQLGDGTTTASITPVTVSGISTATEIAAGILHSCALLTSGAVQCWGRNYEGQLGNGTRTDSTTPVTVGGINSATALSAGSSHSCALLASGVAQCWGEAAYSKLGNGLSERLTTPVSVISSPDVAWSSSDPSVASITTAGLATVLNTGTAAITATSGIISASTTLTANPANTYYSLSLATLGNGIVSGAGNYIAGQTAMVTAAAKPGSFFAGWSGADSAACATGYVLMNANKRCIATFTLKATETDLSLTLTDAPDPVRKGAKLVYTLTVLNKGPNNASNVVLTDILPANITFIGVTTTQGTCSGTAKVTCSIGALSNGAKATVTVAIKPMTTGTISSSASVTATESDPVNTNNSAIATTTVKK